MRQNPCKKPIVGKYFFYGICCLLASALFTACSGNGSSTTGTQSTTSEDSASSDIVDIPPTPTPELLDLAQHEEIHTPQLELPVEGEEIAVLQTSKGTIKLRFFPEYAPKAVENFITHAKNKYYDNLIFHRIIEGFVVQGGDPRGDGTGGQSIWGDPFEIEIPPNLHHLRGALAMARGEDPSSQGSQFYIVQNKGLTEDEVEWLKGYLPIQDQVAAEDESGNKLPFADFFPEKIINKYIEEGGTPSLDFQYTVFGQVIEGLDIVDQIAAVETSPSDDPQRPNKPLEDVIIQSISFETYKAS